MNILQLNELLTENLIVFVNEYAINLDYTDILPAIFSPSVKFNNRSHPRFDYRILHKLYEDIGREDKKILMAKAAKQILKIYQPTCYRLSDSLRMSFGFDYKPVPLCLDEVLDRFKH